MLIESLFLGVLSSMLVVAVEFIYAASYVLLFIIEVALLSSAYASIKQKN